MKNIAKKPHGRYFIELYCQCEGLSCNFIVSNGIAPPLYLKIQGIKSNFTLPNRRLALYSYRLSYVPYKSF